jgi:hypothetical protein
MLKLKKCKPLPSRCPKISNLGMVVEYFTRNNSPFGKKFKFTKEFELKIQEGKQI